MRKSTRILRMAVHLAIVAALGLGGAYWLGHDIPLEAHMACGLLAVAGLLGLAGQTLRRSAPIAAATALWGLFLPVLGIAQLVVPAYLQMEEAQTLLRGLHVLAGLATIGLAEHLARRLAH